MFEVFEGILRFVIGIIDSFGYWGIGAGMLLESACIPLPSEIVLPLAGNMVANGRISMLEANVAVASGSMAGSYMAYAIGYLGGRPFIMKYGKVFFISEKHFLQAEKSFRKHGAAVVFFGRLLPVIRTFISLPAGIAKMDIGKFSLYSLIGMLPWNFTLIFLGKEFGESYEEVIRPVFKRFEYTIIGLIILSLILFGIKYTLSRKKTGLNKGYHL